MRFAAGLRWGRGGGELERRPPSCNSGRSPTSKGKVEGKSACLVNFFRESAPGSPGGVFVATKAKGGKRRGREKKGKKGREGKRGGGLRPLYLTSGYGP